MKVAIALALLVSAATLGGAASAQTPPLQYKDLVRDARRVEHLEGGERFVSPKIIYQTVTLDLKPFGQGSKDYYVVKRDEVGFICSTANPGFKGGKVTTRVMKHEEGGEGSHFFTLENCTTATK